MEELKMNEVLNLTDLIKEKEVTSLYDQVVDKCYDIPFGNSCFQNVAFVEAAALTKPRAARAVALKLLDKLNSLKDFYFSIEERKITLDELKFKMENKAISEFELRRLKLSFERESSTLFYNQKLLKDLIYECSYLHAQFAKYPKYTVQEFEMAEKEYFERSLLQQANTHNNGAVMSILNMTEDFKHLNLEFTQESIPVITKDFMESLTNEAMLLGNNSDKIKLLNVAIEKLNAE